MKQFLYALALAALAWGAATPGHAQQTYECVQPGRPGSDKGSAGAQFTPPNEQFPLACDSPAVYYVRVNVHYMLNQDGTGNFTEDDDAGSQHALDWNQAGPNFSALPAVSASTTYNGYQYAKDIIVNAANRFANNVQADQPTGNSIPVRPIRISYVLGGVYFHRDSTLYKYNQLGPDYYTAPDAVLSPAQFNAYGANKNSEINVFLMGQSTNQTIRPGGSNFYRWAYLSGGANTFGYSAGNNWVKIGNVWRVHLLTRANNNGVDNVGADAIGRVINHELGHKFDLYHPFQGDDCDDTFDGAGAGSNNNLMNYGSQLAVTPCQLNKMHATLRNYYGGYYSCGTCQPPSAFFTLPEVYYNWQPNVIYQGCLPMDGRGSYLGTDYSISLTKVNNSNQAIGATSTINSFGEPGALCLNNQFYFQRNARYAVKLTVNNLCSSSSLTRYVNTRDAVMAEARTAGSSPEAAPTLYPNPTTSTGFTLHSLRPTTELPTVHDGQGQRVAVELVSQVEDETGWHSTYRLGPQRSKGGLYLVEVLVAGKRTTHRLSVQAE